MYPHAIYHLQQAVEKTVKGTFLFMGTIKKEDLYGRDGINHKTPSAFLKALRQTFWKEVSASLNNKSTNGEDLESFMTSFTEEQFANMSSGDIHLIMTTTKGEQGLEYAKVHIENIEAEVKEAKSKGEKVRDLPEEFKSISLAFGQAFGKLFGLSVITFPHWTFTRYPDKLVRPEHYVPTLGIVKEYKFLYNELSIAINSINCMLELIERTSSDIPK